MLFPYQITLTGATKDMKGLLCFHTGLDLDPARDVIVRSGSWRIGKGLEGERLLICSLHKQPHPFMDCSHGCVERSHA